jgi:hypothetical protein
MAKHKEDNTMAKNKEDNAMAKNKEDNAMAKNKEDNAMAKHKEDNTMAKTKRTYRQTKIHKILHRMLKIEQHEPCKKSEIDSVIPDGKAVLASSVDPVVLSFSKTIG